MVGWRWCWGEGNSGVGLWVPGVVLAQPACELDKTIVSTLSWWRLTLGETSSVSEAHIYFDNQGGLHDQPVPVLWSDSWLPPVTPS